VQELRATADAAREPAAQVQAAQTQAAQAQAAQAQTGSITIAPILRPRGDAGKDFKLQDAMGLGGDQGLYRSIQVSRLPLVFMVVVGREARVFHIRPFAVDVNA
jgi:hypothetical protein